MRASPGCRSSRFLLLPAKKKWRAGLAMGVNEYQVKLDQDQLTGEHPQSS